MDYLLFTYPNCSQCEVLKGHLGGSSLEGQEYSLVLKESKLKIRDYLSVLKRDEKGGIVIPTLILQEKGKVLAVLNGKEELEEWLKSKG